MAISETRIHRDPKGIEARLAELGLSPEKLLRVRTKALAAAANADASFPANAAGTFAYHFGTSGLREEFGGTIWTVDRAEGVEAIRNDGLKIKVVFANVDLASDLGRQPKPRSRKGSGSERICSGNDLFGEVVRYVQTPAAGWAIYYLMVDERGAAELSRPVVKLNTFAAYVERIILTDGADLDLNATSLLDDSDVVKDFDPQVARK